MNDVTDNAKNNFGDPLDAMYIACARSVSENVGLLLKNSYVVSDNFDLVLTVVSWQWLCPPPPAQLTCNCSTFFGTQKEGSRPMSYIYYIYTHIMLTRP